VGILKKTGSKNIYITVQQYFKTIFQEKIYRWISIDIGKINNKIIETKISG